MATKMLQPWARDAWELTYRVDFFWPDLGLVVETDSLRHHRTAAEQATDLSRDQAHARTGLRSLRFTHSQVFHRPDYVCAVLRDTCRAIAASRGAIA